jgi:hypothetical protein
VNGRRPAPTIAAARRSSTGCRTTARSSCPRDSRRRSPGLDPGIEAAA